MSAKQEDIKYGLNEKQDVPTTTNTVDVADVEPIYSPSRESDVTTVTEREMKLTGTVDITNVTDEEDTSSTLSSDVDNNFPDEPETSEEPKVINQMDPFINTILQGFKNFAPNLRYKPKYLRGKKYRVIPFEFASLWKNLPSLFTEKEVSQQQKVIMPRVAWEKVNKSALSKLPKPSSYPIHSVSPTSSIYGKSCKCPQFALGKPSPCSVLQNFKPRIPSVLSLATKPTLRLQGFLLVL